MTTLPSQIGPYAVASELGRGGMGVVYLATDSRLGRQVAIKALPEHFATDPERLARFEREARTLASLNHPNVAGIHGVEEHDGRKYLVLEYVEGITLADRLDRGALPVDEALEICAQVAAGLEAAHEAGVIHRDLKPANIRITPEGQAKVLDFGLARTEEATSSGSSVSQMPTLTTPHSPTQAGAILGTAPYMSPEQARGRRVDKRSDIWSFGVLLYECLTGMSPFIGETATDSIGAILHKDVDLDRLPMGTPPIVRHVLKRCLQRDRNERLRDIGDARIELSQAHTSEGFETGADASASKRPVGLAFAALIAVVFALLGAGGVYVANRPAPARVIVASIEPAEGEIILFSGDLAGPANVSRDGSMVCYVAKRTGEEQVLHIRALDSATSTPVRGTEGATFPFWSWDGKSIGYFAKGELRRHDIETRTNRTICEANGGRGGAWLADDTIVFTPNFQSEIVRVSASGGELTPVTTVDSSRHTSHRWANATPDGKGFVYIAVSHERGKLDESTLYLWRSPEQPAIELTRTQYRGQIVSGHLLVVRDGSLIATPINARTGELTGSPVTLVENVLADLSTWFAGYSAAENGVLVYHEESEEAFESQRVDAGSTYGEARMATIVLRDGRPTYTVATGVPQNSVSVSPDDRFLAISGAPEEHAIRTGFDVWMYELPLPSTPGSGSLAPMEAPPRRLTFLDGNEMAPRWSPDGEWITFGLTATMPGAKQEGLYRIRVGGGREELLLAVEGGDDFALVPTDWTSDGRYIIYNQGPWIQTLDNNVYAYDLENGVSIPLVVQAAEIRNGKVSPDGKWLAYRSDESGTNEVYVVPFKPYWDDVRAAGEATPPEDARWRISIAGSEAHAWSPKGDELFYLASSDTLVAIAIESDGPNFSHDVGTPLFDAARGEAGSDIDVMSDAMRFVVNSEQQQRRSSISLITDWRALLRD